VWQISRTRPTGGSWSNWGSATVVATYTERQSVYKRNNSGTTAPAFSTTTSGVPYGWSSSQPTPTSSNRYVWQISRSRPNRQAAPGPIGAAPPSSLPTPKDRRCTNGTTRVRRPRRSAPPPVGCLMAGRRRSRRLPPAIATCGASAARGRRAGRGLAGAEQPSSLPTPSARRGTNATTRVRRPRRSAPPVGCLMAGRRRSRRLRRATATCGRSAARGRRAGRGLAGAEQPSSLPTPSARRGTNATTRVRRPRRSAPPPVGCLTAGRRRSQRLPQAIATCGASAARGRRAGRGPTGAVLLSWSNWGSATVVATYTERQTAYRLHTSGTIAPTFTASASTVPTGWSSTRPTPNPYAPYVWRISRSRPTGGSWSNWGGATVVNTWTAATGRYRDGLQRRGPLYASHFRQ
jgi:hypothetical protein